MRKIAYVRVSTADQRHDRQIEGLMACCDEVHVETLSACAAKRPVYERVLRRLKPGDMLVVWDLDRAFRSTVDALIEAEKLRRRGIHLQIANLHIDTTMPAGMLAYTVMAAFAEFERRMISKRTKEGLAAARKRGARLGRPPRLSEQQLRRARRRIERERIPVSKLAQELGVARWTLARALQRQNSTSISKSRADTA